MQVENLTGIMFKHGIWLAVLVESSYTFVGFKQVFA